MQVRTCKGLDLHVLLVQQSGPYCNGHSLEACGNKVHACAALAAGTCCCCGRLWHLVCLPAQCTACQTAATHACNGKQAAWGWLRLLVCLPAQCIMHVPGPAAFLGRDVGQQHKQAGVKALRRCWEA